MNRRRWLAQAIALGTLAAGCGKPKAANAVLTVAAAASLRAVLPALAKAYEAKRPGLTIRATYGASGDLQKQVEGGAPIDVVMFASDKPVEALVRARLVVSKSVVATNALVLIGPKGGRAVTFATIDALPANEKIAIGDPGAVPAGQYAREYLTALGKWDALRGRLVLAGDVSAVLAYARRGEVAAAIVYRTEVRGIADVVVLDEASGPLAPRPEVVAGPVAGGEKNDFVAFAASPEGQRIFAEFGFGPP